MPKYRYELMYIPELGLTDNKPWILRIFLQSTDNLVFHQQYTTLSDVTEVIELNEHIRETKDIT